MVFKYAFSFFSVLVFSPTILNAAAVVVPPAEESEHTKLPVVVSSPHQGDYKPDAESLNRGLAQAERLLEEDREMKRNKDED